jgi:BolA family transcriptional regulator, general stress-responsive regulator
MGISGCAHKSPRNARARASSLVKVLRLWHNYVSRNLMSVEQSIREKLARAFEPTRLEVVNESHLHAGHRSSPGTGESHFRVLIVAPLFAGKSRLERHRLVNATLAAELAGKVHALALRTYAPGETVA